jgi:ABC-type branched-subunit amino acid transport system substrate-binding protein
VKRRKISAVLSICIVLSLVALAFTTACPSQAPPAEKTLKIGALLSVSGWYSVIDALESAEVQAVAQYINDEGGITIDGQKYQIELVIEDGKSDFDGVAAAANRLVYDRGVSFVVGPTAFFSTASSPIFEQNKTLHVSGYITAAPGDMDASTPYGFLGHNCAIADAVAAVMAMKSEFPDANKVAIALPDEGTLDFVMPKHKKAIGLHGITVVGDTIGYPNEMEDFSPIVAKLDAIKDADAYLLLNGAPPHLGNILKGLREIGNDKPCITSSLVSCNVIAAISGPAAATGAISLAITPHAPGNSPQLDAICDMLGTQYEEQGVIYMMTGNSLWVLAQVIESAQSLDPTVVKEKWESMDTVETLFGTGILSGDETYGIKHHAIGHPLPYQKLMDGEVSHGGWVDVGAIP